ncbi:hypothetical protein [Butyrivibrio sp. AE2032]|uniref:hypothetical protein n=1 Tax=Butyrivibrio sp. AE2032 TaxID=1458463 RepID=UPI000553AB1D|nr:hypothetical protein [Butyrivibrio sp. AE2032]
MGKQLVLVMETNKECSSDYMYIRSVIENYYDVLSRPDFKLTPVYMSGKGNYNSQHVRGAINRSIKAYARNGPTQVAYCFDTDRYESDQDAAEALEKEKQFCEDNNYKFIWFCHDIEEVFLGESVHDGEKKEKARQFIAKRMITTVKTSMLRVKTISKGRSNLLIVLDNMK